MKSGFVIRRSPAAENFQLQTKPQHWGFAPEIRFAERLMIEQAHAEGGGEIAGILMGIAGIISAMAPEKIAKIQSQSEIMQAMIQSNAQIQMTQISAETSKYVSNQATRVTLEQTKAAERINTLNQDGVTQRLDMQLAELRSAREDSATREKERLAEEKRLNDERMQLAQKQADDNVKLARQSLNAQLTQAGLQTGFGNSRNSGNALTAAVVDTSQSNPTSLASTLAANTSAKSLGLGKGAAPSSAPASESTPNGSGLLELLESPKFSSSPLVASAGPVSGVASASALPSAAGAGGADRAVAIDFRSRLLGAPGTSGGGAIHGGGSVGSGSSSAGASIDVGDPKYLSSPTLGSHPRLLSGSSALVRGAKANVTPPTNVRALASLLNGQGHRAIRGSTNRDRVGLGGGENDRKKITPVLSQTIDQESLRTLRRGRQTRGSGHGGTANP